MSARRPGSGYAALLAAGLAVGLAILAGCVGLDPDAASDDIANQAPLGADFGNAVTHNAAQHILDPMSARVPAGAPAMDGVRAGKAIRRYREGTVIAPHSVETSNFGDNQ